VFIGAECFLVEKTFLDSGESMTEKLSIRAAGLLQLIKPLFKDGIFTGALYDEIHKRYRTTQHQIKEAIKELRREGYIRFQRDKDGSPEWSLLIENKTDKSTANVEYQQSYNNNRKKLLSKDNNNLPKVSYRNQMKSMARDKWAEHDLKINKFTDNFFAILKHWNENDCVTKHKIPYLHQKPAKCITRAAKFIDKLKQPVEDICAAIDTYVAIVKDTRAMPKIGLDEFFFPVDVHFNALKAREPDFKSWYEECIKEGAHIRWTKRKEKDEDVEADMPRLKELAKLYFKINKGGIGEKNLTRKDWVNLSLLLKKLDAFHAKHVDTSNPMDNTLYTIKWMQKNFMDALANRFKGNLSFSTGQLLSTNSWRIFKDHITEKTGRKYAD
jgi:hypothetical protein